MFIMAKYYFISLFQSGFWWGGFFVAVLLGFFRKCKSLLQLMKRMEALGAYFKPQKSGEIRFDKNHFYFIGQMDKALQIYEI